MFKGAKKGQTAKYRLFGGKTFTRRFHFGTKAEAERYAKSEREKGYQVRVIRESGGYVTYRRNATYAS